MKKFGIAAVGLVVLVLAGLVVKGLFFGPSDQELIGRTLAEATEAAAKGEPSPVLDALSRNFEYGDEMPVRIDVAKVVREAKPEMVILNPLPRIDGDGAVVVSDVALKVDFMGMAQDLVVPEVTILLKKETTFRNLIPEPKWRVTKVSAKTLPSNY